MRISRSVGGPEHRIQYHRSFWIARWIVAPRFRSHGGAVRRGGPKGNQPCNDQTQHVLNLPYPRGKTRRVFHQDLLPFLLGHGADMSSIMRRELSSPLPHGGSRLPHMILSMPRS